MILDLIRGGSFTNVVIGLCVSIFVVFCIIPLHEYAHAWVAFKLGDDTGRLSGRLTLNPLAHINWLGALMIVLCGFGFAQPVPVNINNVKMKNKKLAMAIIAFAGPMANLIIAFISVFAENLCMSFRMEDQLFSAALCLFFRYNTIININLAVFNLIPVPPLDGSRILLAVLPTKYYFSLMKYERYITIGIMLLLLTGVLSAPLSILSNLVYKVFARFWYMIFSLFVL